MAEKEMIKTDHAGYVKDPKSGAIINRNHDEYMVFQGQKNNAKKIVKLENDIGEIRTDLAEIKELIMKVFKQ